MGKKRQRQASMRPEKMGPAEELYGEDAGRYHRQNAGLQLDMAELGVALLCLQGTTNLLADLGCGSGLSAAALSRQGGIGGWVGTDITPEMARLAAGQAGAAGCIALSDFGQGLPFRPACLDGAISISAVQWLCSAADPPTSIRRFFAALHASLRPNARAALQVYPEDDNQAKQLVEGALHCGLHAGFCVAFPHSTPAKKFYLVVQRPCTALEQQGGVQLPAKAQQPANLCSHPCNLPWPKAGSCILSWMRYLQQQQLPVGSMAEAAARTQQEHASLGRRMVRVLRRAAGLSAPEGNPEGTTDTAAGKGSSSTANPGCTGTGQAPVAAPADAVASADAADAADSSFSTSGSSVIVQAELEVHHRGLMPCGGAIFLQLTAAAEPLSASNSSMHGASATGGACLEEAATVGQGEVPTNAAAEQPDGSACGAGFDTQQIAAAAEAACQQWLLGLGPCASSSSGGSRGTSADDQCQVQCHELAKIAGAEDVALHSSQQPSQAPLFVGPPEGSAVQAHRFMRLEPLEAVQQQGLAAAVLHAHKLAPHLVLRFSCSTGDGSKCGRCGGSSSSSSGHGGNGSCCAAGLAQRMQALCAELNACVVGVDMHLLPGRVDAAWVIWLAGLQQHAERDGLAAAVLRLFAA